ncbi:helix-turn-helix domain-containing protein [Streptomyces sp. NPDC057746]|uniref:helix-turn-helix domain-containing protein n=1 Tax=Streptomyces sp. NPDC057746 TaxID=3346237 RepID=UPI0036A6B4B3
MTQPSGGRRRRPMNHEPDAVIYARERAGLTQLELAERCGISQQLVSKIEAGTRNATPTVLTRMASELNCPLVVLEAKRHAAVRPEPCGQGAS